MFHYIRIPGPGDLRGQGSWTRVNDKTKIAMGEWEHARKTGTLPVAKCYAVPETLLDVESDFVVLEDVDGRWLVHQFLELGMPLHSTSEKHLSHAHAQLKSLVDLLVAGEAV